MKEVQFFKWNPVLRNYNLTEEKLGELKPHEIDSIFVTGTALRIYLKKFAKL
jgi:hypothetical protein